MVWEEKASASRSLISCWFLLLFYYFYEYFSGFISARGIIYDLLFVWNPYYKTKRNAKERNIMRQINFRIVVTRQVDQLYL
eukprot:gene8064-5616_t